MTKTLRSLMLTFAIALIAVGSAFAHPDGQPRSQAGRQGISNLQDIANAMKGMPVPTTTAFGDLVAQRTALGIDIKKMGRNGTTTWRFKASDTDPIERNPVYETTTKKSNNPGSPLQVSSSMGVEWIYYQPWTKEHGSATEIWFQARGSDGRLRRAERLRTHVFPKYDTTITYNHKTETAQLSRDVCGSRIRTEVGYVSRPVLRGTHQRQ